MQGFFYDYKIIKMISQSQKWLWEISGSNENEKNQLNFLFVLTQYKAMITIKHPASKIIPV